VDDDVFMMFGSTIFFVYKICRPNFRFAICRLIQYL